MRVVVDTNILISATAWEGNERELIRRAVRGDVTVLISEEILAEYLDVIQRGRFSFLSKTKIKRFVLLLLEFCECIEVKTKVKVVSEDPSDDMVLACAKDGKAEVVVTGDMHLLRLRNWSGVRIIACRELLKEIH